MKILAIDTATEVCSVAILEDKDVLIEKTLNSVNTHSVELMPLIDSILIDADLTLNDIDLFACDNGPGSFTGIRIGISTVKAFSDVTNKPCVGVSSLEGFTYCEPIPDSFLICSLINANHDNVYYGLFELKDGNINKMEDFSFKSIQEVLSHLNNIKKNIFFVGNCGTLFKDMIESECNFNFKISSINSISATYIGKSAFYKFISNETENESLLPLYLKSSSAEIKK